VASSHIRIGTFQYLSARDDQDGLRTLADYVLERHYPELRDEPKRYTALLQSITDRQATLIAQWMDLGFIHGVMNTDNMTVSGETIDYGPCAFMESFAPTTVFSSIDRNGRYAYGNQPAIAVWNLSRLAETLLALLESEAGSHEAAIEAAYSILNSFQPTFEAAHLDGLRRKLGLSTAQDSDVDLIKDLLQRMTVNCTDFTLAFRRLCDCAESVEADGQLLDLFPASSNTGEAIDASFSAWLTRWRDRLATEPIDAADRALQMRRANPVYIPRNHQVQEVIDAAVLRDDYTPFEDLLEVLSSPFEDQAGRERYAQPARPEERVLQTFCGT
jgi:uncharacterized protein YdiU (UPF0061 family)